MNASEVKVWVEIVTGVVTVIGVPAAGVKALWEWQRSTEHRKEELSQRRQEFRQKQAIFARALVREVFADPKARAALNMLDWKRDSYPGDNGEMHEIHFDEVKHAMRGYDMNFSEKEKFMRKRFEALYDHLEEIEQLISVRVVNFEDVKTAFGFYAQLILQDEELRAAHLQFLDDFDYPRARAFLLRFGK